jgi:hypothetical protein
MALSVISFATYKRPPYERSDFPALKFVKAVKGKPFTGYADLLVLGRWKHLIPANAEEAVEWFGELAAAELVREVAGPLTLVPLPNSSSTVDNNKEPRTALLAGSIACKLLKATVWDGLRWIEQMIPTHQEGTRDPQELYENLRVTRAVPKGTIVLVDDVYTKGGHLQAAVARLADKKAACRLAVCAGRTVLESQDNPFAAFTEELPEFVPCRE